VYLILPLLILAGGQQAPDTSQRFIQQAIGVPTGRNGYEEYVAAAQIAESPEYAQFEGYTPGKDAANKETLLDVWREQVRRFAPISDLITQGNTKSVYDPKPRLNTGASPELSGFPAVVDYFARSAYVSLANGDPQTAERTLETALQFVYNLDNGTEGSGTMAALSANHLFKAISADFPKFGTRELDRLANAATALLGQEPSPLNNLRAIRQSDMATAERTLRDPRSAGPMALAIQSLNGNQRETALRLFVADEDSYLQSVINTASDPEAKWERVPFEEQNAVAAGLARSSIAGNSGLLQNSAKLRTRLRIMRLMARVYQYNWQFNELPQAKAPAAKPAESQDPLSGAELTYSPKGSSFEVTSDGSDWSGPVPFVQKT
jgi:hypothetical protein